MNAPTTPTVQLLRLSCGGAPLLLPVVAVREILRATALTRLPRTPAFVLGVMNLRGAVVPVLDLALQLGRTSAPSSSRNAVVVVELAEAPPATPLVLGLRVDMVHEVLDVHPERLEDAPDLGVDIAAPHLAGMLNLGTQHAPVLDLKQLLAPDSLSQLIAAHGEPA